MNFEIRKTQLCSVDYNQVTGNTIFGKLQYNTIHKTYMIGVPLWFTSQAPSKVGKM